MSTKATPVAPVRSYTAGAKSARLLAMCVSGSRFATVSRPAKADLLVALDTACMIGERRRRETPSLKDTSLKESGP